ncbi:MAG TPA: CDP-glucose 4,6-dehydratase [Solirubrobacteraceae bacterium]|jgi:CDP-glucose 4,6-dehydratase
MNSSLDPSFWRNRRVLLTGHTGFKGAWLSLWLQALGSRLTGVSLAAPPTKPSLYELARVGEGMASHVACDVRHASALAHALAEAHPEVVIHMAAQPLVRHSFAAPAETYDTNVMGTVNLLDAIRACHSVRAVVVVTSDKCYAPSAMPRAHSEEDPLGGEDPYSSSKAAAELLTAAYRRSFFSDPDAPRLATARAGNVIGGGDFAADRLLPDLFRAAAAGETVRLRNPTAVRPWQHVLSPLSGYLVLAQALHRSPNHARAWNFGPEECDARTVEWVVGRVSRLLPRGLSWEVDDRGHPPERPHLTLDSSLSRELLGWAPLTTLEEGLSRTVEWFRAHWAGEDLRAVTLAQIESAAPSAQSRRAAEPNRR